jgi:hypothetical protein
MDAFAFLNAFSRRGQELAVWREIFEQSLSPEDMIFKFLGLLRSDARQMWQLLMGEAEPVRLPPFVKSQKEAMARRLGAGGLTRLFDLAMDAELGIKSGAEKSGSGHGISRGRAFFPVFAMKDRRPPPFFLVLPRLLGHFSHKSTGQDHAFGGKTLARPENHAY